MACCKINAAICSTATDCDNSTSGGAKQIRIAPTCHVLSYTETTCADANFKEITGITMDNDILGTGDADHLFYEIEVSDDTLEFVFDWQYDNDAKSIVFNETVNLRTPVKNSSALCTMETLMGKEVVVLVLENGSQGRWIITGHGGDMFFQAVTGGTGLLKTDTTDTNIVITGALDTRFQYVNWAAGDDAAATLAELDAISVLCP